MEERVWHKAYMPAVPHSIDYENVTLPQALERTAKNFSNNTAIIMMGKKITYRQLDESINRFASALAQLGVKKGDRVALVLPNIPQFVIATYAIWRLGAVVVMNNPLYTERELTHQLNDSGATIAIVLDLLVPRILSIKENTQIKQVIACHIKDYLPFPLKQLFPMLKKDLHRATQPSDGVVDFLDLMNIAPKNGALHEDKYEDLAALLYTGGTTGVSKGVMLTHKNLSVNVQQLKALMYNAEEGNETVIGILPFFHSAGFTVIMNHCLYRGLAIVMVVRPDANELVKNMIKYKPGLFGGVPTLYVGLLEHPDLPPKSELSYMKGSISGAAPLALETIRDWDKRVGAQIVEVYGMTEMSPVSHANPWGGTSKAGSVGVPLPDTDCRIVDVETGEKDMPLGEPGEIILKGPQQMTGYYNRSEENAKSIHDGWFYTGDVGYMDDEGYLYVVDRTKDMIIAGGYNIYPREIDEILYEHPKVLEACSAGVPDKYRGETVKAYVVVKDGETLTKEELIAYCKEKLAAYKVPRQIEFMDALPKSAIGKVLRRELLDMEAKRDQAQ